MPKHVKFGGKSHKSPGTSKGTKGGPLSGKRTPRAKVKESPTPRGASKR